LSSDVRSEKPLPDNTPIKDEKCRTRLRDGDQVQLIKRRQASARCEVAASSNGKPTLSTKDSSYFGVSRRFLFYL
jgi:hypothetical protein